MEPGERGAQKQRPSQIGVEIYIQISIEIYLLECGWAHIMYIHKSVSHPGSRWQLCGRSPTPAASEQPAVETLTPPE